MSNRESDVAAATIRRVETTGPVGATSVSRTDALAAAFSATALPKPEWTHHAHLRVGLWHLLHHSAEDALDLLRSRIRALNESHGVVNNEHGGYHETITRFYVWRIASHLAAIGSDAATDVDTLADEIIRLYGDKELPLRYWSQQRLMSREARFGWVEPDLQPLV